MTRGRLLAGAIVALLALLTYWVVRNTTWVEIDVPAPLRGEALANPFYFAQRLAETLGAQTRRDVTLDLPSPDGVLVASNWSWGLTDSQRRALEEWVEAGGRLVVDDALYDGSGSFERWSGIAHFTPDSRAESDPFGEPAGAAGPECHSLNVEASEQPAELGERYTLCGVLRRRLLSLRDDPAWSLGDDTETFAVRTSVGRGSVTAVAGVPFVRAQIYEGDHAAIFVAATQLRAGDEIRFLHGEDADSLVTLAWRYGSPVILLALAGIGAWLVRGAARFGPLVAPVERSRRSLAEQIRGTGQFALRFGGGAALQRAAARALREAATARLPSFASSSAAEQAASIARATGGDAAALASALDGAREAAGDSGRRASAGQIASAIAVLEAARRALLESGERGKHGI